MTLRERIRLPDPQATGHEPQAPHAVNEQSTAHGCAAQPIVSVSAWHVVPPYSAGCAIVRLRVLVPPPHVAVHADQAENALTSQCIGHACSLHERLS